jgi:hypothetical protein
MANAPKFFVPAATPETQEAVYAEFARRAGRPVPKLEDRVYSITYTHNGETWTSTVGETSRGTRVRTVGRGSARREYPTGLSDPAVILAIFPGDPYVGITNHGIAGNVGSTWANPFYMGALSIQSVVLFAPG